jgi:hypothetical protein
MTAHIRNTANNISGPTLFEIKLGFDAKPSQKACDESGLRFECADGWKRAERLTAEQVPDEEAQGGQGHHLEPSQHSGDIRNDVGVVDHRQVFD